MFSLRKINIIFSMICLFSNYKMVVFLSTKEKKYKRENIKRKNEEEAEKRKEAVAEIKKGNLIWQFRMNTLNWCQYFY